jgi:hypothetical protein
MAVDGNAVVDAPFHEGVGPLESPSVLTGVNRARLHAGLRRHDAEVPLDEAPFLVGVVAGQISRRADEKVILVNVLDGRAVPVHRRRCFLLLRLAEQQLGEVVRSLFHTLKSCWPPGMTRYTCGTFFSSSIW